MSGIPSTSVKRALDGMVSSGLLERNEKDRTYGITDAGMLEIARVYMKPHVEKKDNTVASLIRMIWEEATPQGRYTSHEIHQILGGRGSESSVLNIIGGLKKDGFLQRGREFRYNHNIQ